MPSVHPTATTARPRRSANTADARRRARLLPYLFSCANNRHGPRRPVGTITRQNSKPRGYVKLARAGWNVLAVAQRLAAPMSCAPPANFFDQPVAAVRCSRATEEERAGALNPVLPTSRTSRPRIQTGKIKSDRELRPQFGVRSRSLTTCQLIRRPGRCRSSRSSRGRFLTPAPANPCVLWPATQPPRLPTIRLPAGGKRTFLGQAVSSSRAA